MKKAFIINPKSGRPIKTGHMIRRIEDLKKSRRDVDLFLTQAPMDAAVISRALADEAERSCEKVRIFACGGDGTLNEIVNGAALREGVEIGTVPVGSGNDFVRNFEGCDFMDLDTQLEAETRAVDLIRCDYKVGGKHRYRYGINGINIGFDGNSAILSHKLRQKPLIGGTSSYMLAVMINLIYNTGCELKISSGGKVLHDGKLFLCTVSSGRFCGGGVESCPKAEPDNGLAEVLIIKNVSRRKFVSRFPSYMNGRILDSADFDEFGKYMRSAELTIEPREESMQFVMDGETVRTGSVKIKIIKRVMQFVVPEAGK